MKHYISAHFNLYGFTQQMGRQKILDRLQIDGATGGTWWGGGGLKRLHSFLQNKTLISNSTQILFAVLEFIEPTDTQTGLARGYESLAGTQCGDTRKWKRTIRDKKT